MAPRGGGGRSFGGGGYGGGRVISGARGSAGRNRDGTWGLYPAPRTVVAPPPLHGGSGCGGGGGFKHIYDHRDPDDPDAQPWYNSCLPRTRWHHALVWADLSCRKKPKGMECQSYLELLVDAPPHILRDIAERSLVDPDAINKLPPLLYPDFPINHPPLIIHDACYKWTERLQKCRDKHAHFADEWKCVPFKGFVEDHCSRSRT